MLKLLFAIDACDEKYEDEMESDRNFERTCEHFPAGQEMSNGQVAIVLTRPIKYGKSSATVSGDDYIGRDPMRECDPGRGKDRIHRDKRKKRLTRKQIFSKRCLRSGYGDDVERSKMAANHTAVNAD